MIRVPINPSGYGLKARNIVKIAMLFFGWGNACMAIEKLRGCGYRKVGGLYLMGVGIARPCDMLPLKLEECPTCGFEMPFTRNFMWIKKQWLSYQAEDHHRQIKCRCPTYAGVCPLCFPLNNELEQYGFMWVGAQYTPESFIKEAKAVGVSKRIGNIPKNLLMHGRWNPKITETWVLLAHKKVPFAEYFANQGMAMEQPIYYPAVFYAFKPTRIEKLVWKSEANPTLLDTLKKQGITPIVVPDGDKEHAPNTPPITQTEL